MGPGGVPGVSNGQRATTPGSINLFLFLFAFLKKKSVYCVVEYVCIHSTCVEVRGTCFRNRFSLPYRS